MAIKGLEIPVSGNTTQLREDINNATKNPVVVEIKASVNNLEKISKDIQAQIDSVLHKNKNTGEISLKVKGIDATIKQLKDVNESIRNIQESLSIRKSFEILPDIENKQKQLDGLNKTLMELSEKRNTKYSKMNLDEYINSDQAIKEVKKITKAIKDGSDLGVMFEKNTSVQNLLSQMTKAQVEQGNLNKEIRISETETISLQNLLDSIIQSLQNTTKAGSDLNEILSKANLDPFVESSLLALGNISRLTQEIKSVQAELKIAEGRESGAINISLDQGSIDKLSQEIAGLKDKLKLSDDATIGFKQEDIDKVTSAFERLQQTLEEISTTIKGIDFSKFNSLGDTVSQTPVSSGGQNGLDDNFTQKLEQEKQTVDEIVEHEKAKFEELVRELDTAIPQAVQTKNEAFEVELSKVTEVVDAEVKKLKELEGELDNVKDHLKMDAGNYGNRYDSDSGSGKSRKKGKSESDKYDDKEAQKIADAIETEIDKQRSQLDGVITNIDRAYDSHDNLIQALIRVERNITDEDGRLAKQVERFNIKYDKKGNIAYTSTMESDNYKAAEAEVAKEAAKAEKEAIKQAQEAERKRQALYKQMQKASSDKQYAQEKQRQSEINALLSEQKNAYQKVWDIRKQIVKLDPDKNTEEISELEKQKQLALEIYAERTKELKSIDEIANSEAQNNTLLQMRQKALNEIAIIEAKLRDRGVVSDQPSPKDDTTKYTNLLARREIQQGNLDAAKIRNDQTAIKYSQERISALNNEIEALEKLGNIDKEVAEQNLKNEIARINASEKVAKAEDAQAKQRTVNLNRQSKMIKDFSLWLSKNGVAAKAYSNEIELIFNQLQQQGELTAEQLNKVQHEINNIMATAAREGKTGVTFIETLQQRFKSLAAYLASFASFYDVIRYVREGIDIVRQYDTALTEMRKVSDESLSTLKDYASTTFDVGDAVGATALTIQNSTADWMRLGEAINEAQESAKVSNILLNVSEFENIDDATTSLVAMSQAYRDIDKMDIIDKLNNIGNNFSISTDKLAQGLQNAAAVLQTQGNSIDESIALITAANSQVQDISKASGGIRTISLRISGTEEAKAELEDLGEDVEDYIVQTSSKTQETIKNFTAVASNMGKGIDVLDANGNLRNTYDILLDISKIYKEIQEEDKKAGTNRANALVEYLAGRFLPDIYGDIYIKNIFNCKVNLKLYATI